MPRLTYKVLCFAAAEYWNHVLSEWHGRRTPRKEPCTYVRRCEEWLRVKKLVTWRMTDFACFTVCAVLMSFNLVAGGTFGLQPIFAAEWEVAKGVQRIV